MISRRKFIHQSCFACMGLSTGIAFLASCSSVRYASGTLAGKTLSVPLQEFEDKARDGKTIYRSYILVRHDALQYPVCVYRFDGTFKALWMRCTHQGMELQAAGDSLHCSAHGSVFSNQGKVINGPAEQDLRTFNTTTEQGQLIIQLT